MRSTLIRTAAVTSLVTALVVSGAAYYAMPRLMSANEAQPFMAGNPGVTVYPAAYSGAAYQPGMIPAYYTPQPVAYQQTAPRVYRPAAVRTASTASTAPVYGPMRQKRSTGKSVLIVAGSSGAGAAIGGLTGGKKGAAIGAIAGGVAGLIYDRTTANPRD
jgi:hypothetical protein